MSRCPCKIRYFKYQACHGNSLQAEITIQIVGPGGNPFFDISWLAVEQLEVNQQGSDTEAPQHGPRLITLKKFKQH